MHPAFHPIIHTLSNYGNEQHDYQCTIGMTMAMAQHNKEEHSGMSLLQQPSTHLVVTLRSSEAVE